MTPLSLVKGILEGGNDLADRGKLHSGWTTIRVTQPLFVTFDASLATYGQTPLATVVHPDWLLLHDGNQDVQRKQRHGSRWDVLLVGGRARLINSRQRRLRNGQRNRVFLSNLQSTIRPFRTHISILQGILLILPTTMFPTPRERLSKNLLKWKVFPEPTCTHYPQGSLPECREFGTHLPRC